MVGPSRFRLGRGPQRWCGPSRRANGLVTWGGGRCRAGLAVDRDRPPGRPGWRWRPGGWWRWWLAAQPATDGAVEGVGGRRGPARGAGWPRMVGARPGGAGRGTPERARTGPGASAAHSRSRQGSGARQYRDGQHRAQRMPSATPVAGVGDLGEGVGQTTVLVGRQRSRRSQPLGNRGNGDAQAGTAVRRGDGLDTHVIAGSRACLRIHAAHCGCR